MSDSGRVIIEPRDLSFEHAEQFSNAEIQPGMSISWEVIRRFQNPYAPNPTDDPPLVRRIRLVEGLRNKQHTPKIIPNGDGPVPIESVIVHEPPLR